MTLVILCIIMVVGLLMYLLINKPEGAKVAEVGRIMFWTSLLVILLSSKEILQSISGH